MACFCDMKRAWLVNSVKRLLLLLSKASFRDNFDRADQNLEASGVWTTDGTDLGAAAIRSNQLAAAVSDFGNGAAYFSPNLQSSNHFVQVELRSYVSNPGIFACCRLADRNNFIGFLANTGSGGLEVWKRTAGTFINLVSTASGIVVGDVARLEVRHDTYRLLKNGILISSGDMSAPTLISNRQGVVADFAVQNPAFDNYVAGVL